jgi:hypothetical protein
VPSRWEPRGSGNDGVYVPEDANRQLAGEPVRIVSHRGSPMGGTVSLLTFPDLGLAVAAAANVTHAGGVDPFALQVAEAFTRRH